MLVGILERMALPSLTIFLPLGAEKFSHFGHLCAVRSFIIMAFRHCRIIILNKLLLVIWHNQFLSFLGSSWRLIPKSLLVNHILFACVTCITSFCWDKNLASQNSVNELRIVDWQSKSNWLCWELRFMWTKLLRALLKNHHRQSSSRSQHKLLYN